MDEFGLLNVYGPRIKSAREMVNTTLPTFDTIVFLGGCVKEIVSPRKSRTTVITHIIDWCIAFLRKPRIAIVGLQEECNYVRMNRLARVSTNTTKISPVPCFATEASVICKLGI